MRRPWCVLFALCGLAFSATEARATIAIGMSAPLTGPQAAYGTQLRSGLLLGLNEANKKGGIAGRQIVLMVKDDAGSPEQAIKNTRALMDEGVIALTGYHGAQAIEAVLPLIESSTVPLVGVAGGAEWLREPARRNVFNLRAGIREEAAAMVLHLDTLSLREVAVLAQADAMGDAGLEGVQVELVRLAMRPHATVRVSPQASDVALEKAVDEACRTKPQGLLMILNGSNVRTALVSARRRGCSAHYYMTSEAGGQLLLAGSPGLEMAGVIVSQVVPHPSSPLPVSLAFQRASAEGAKTQTHGELEGYIYARVLIESLLRCSNDLTSRCLVKTLESRPVDIGGYQVQFSPGNRRGSRFVEMTVITADGRLRR